MVAPRLAELQAVLQNDILHKDTQSLPRLSVAEGISAKERLGVYQSAYVIRLVEILGEDFDTTWTFIGDELFYDLAQRYTREIPSNSPNARWFSHRFPEFLAGQPVARDCPAVPELARVEQAVNDAFDATNAVPLTIEDLAARDPEEIAPSRFSLHPSVRLLQLTTNAHDIFVALRTDEQPPAPDTFSEPRWVVAWRLDLVSRHMALGAEEGTLLDLLQRGRSFADLCEVAALMNDPDTAALRMAGYLQKWIVNGMLTAG